LDPQHPFLSLSKFSYVEIVLHVITIYSRLETATVKQIQRAEKAGSKIMGQMHFELPTLPYMFFKRGYYLCPLIINWLNALASG
jgi:hypothetical protein